MIVSKWNETHFKAIDLSGEVKTWFEAWSQLTPQIQKGEKMLLKLFNYFCCTFYWLLGTIAWQP